MKNKQSKREINEKTHFDLYAKQYDNNYHYLEPFTKYKINKKFKNLEKFIKNTYGSKPIKILDIGCGTGEYTKIIAKKFPKSKIVGLDISPAILGIAKDKCKGLKNTSFVSRSAYDTKFLKTSFDIVVGFYVLHHINIPKFASEARRILKSNGTLFFCEPNILNPVVYLIKSNKFLKEKVGDSPDEWAINPLAIHREFKGFNVTKISTSEFVWPVKYIPLKLMIVLDTILGYFNLVPLIKYLGGSVQISLSKLDI